MKAERFAAVAAELGEGPTWDHNAEVVYWVDILRGEIHALDLDGQDRLVRTHDEPVGAIALTASGEVIAATPRGLCRADGTVVMPIPQEAPNLRMNDGKPDPAGRFVGGTMTLGDASPEAGSLWSLDGSGSASRLVADATIPNGLAWSADGTVLYWIDTPRQRIDVFDYDIATGKMGERRSFVEIDLAVGSPDGMCIDNDDGLWVALWGGSAVHRYVDGQLDEVIELPTPFVTCPAFAGPTLDHLVITTASIEFDTPPAAAGDLFVVQPGVAGCLPNRLGSWAT
jgi:sugar lactone lactonase YvrE